jgi:hypothetical protein
MSAEPSSLLLAAALLGPALVLGSARSSAAQGPTPQPVTPPQAVTISVEASGESATFTYFNRPIVTLRARIMGRSPAGRAAGAVRIMEELVQNGEIGPVTVTPTEGGLLINVGRHVITGLTTTDLEEGEDLQIVTARATDRIRLALAEAIESRRPLVWLRGGLLTLGAMVVSGLLLWVIGRTRRPSWRA